MSPTDESAMNRWTGHRDAEAFRTLVQRHAGTVYATCKRIVGNVTTAEDITQECFETLARTKATTQIHALGPWLHGVATKRCLVHIRSEGRRRQREAIYASEHDTQTEIQWSDIYDCIDEAIAALPDSLRDPLIAHYFYSDSHAAIARVTGIPRRTVSSRIQRGVESVGASLKARGFTVPSVLLASLFAINLTQAAALPHGLAITLGKIALAGSGSAAVTNAATAPMAAFLSMKGVVLIIAAITTVTAVTLFSSDQPIPDTPAVPLQQAPSAVSPIAQTQPVVQTLPIEAADTAPAALPADSALPAATILAQATDQTAPLGAVIEGTVTFHGEPVAGLFVGASPYLAAEPVFNVTTDAQGYYRAEDLEPQELTIATMLFLVEGRPVTLAEMSNLGELDSPMTHDSTYTAKKRITLDADKTLRVDFELPGPTPDSAANSGLVGYVSVDGQIPEHAQISVQTADNRRTWNADVRSDGFYAAGPIPPGDYFVGLNVLRPRMEWWTRTAIFSDHFTTLDIDADRSHTGAIRGNIRGVRDGEAANAVAFQGDVYIPGAFSPTWLSEVDAPVAAGARYQRGRDEYLMENLAPGTYTVVAVITSAYAHGVPHYGVLDYRIVEITEEGDEATADFEFIFDDPPVIEGVLTGLHPEDNAWVKVYRGVFPMPVPFRESVAPSEFMATQFEAGRRRDIQIWNLEPGTYSLWASASPDLVVGYTKTDGAIVTISGLVVGYKKTDWTVVTIPENQEKPVRVELAPVIRTHKATVHCRALNLRPDRPEVLAYAVSGTRDVPFQATATYWLEVHHGAASSDRALDSDTLTLTGLDPGAYTVIGFHFPVRNTREIRDAAGISSEDFYATTLIASAEVIIREAKEEIQLELAF